MPEVYLPRPLGIAAEPTGPPKTLDLALFFLLIAFSRRKYIAYNETPIERKS